MGRKSILALLLLLLAAVAAWHGFCNLRSGQAEAVGAAYAQYEKAFQAGDLDALRGLVVAARRAEMEGEEAEAALHKAGSYRKAKEAIEAQKKAEEELKKLINESKENQGKSAEAIQQLIEEAMKKQQQAMEDATKLMTGAGSQQKKALEQIEQLIKQAKESG